MKNLFTTFILISISMSGICQVDTLSNNIYQKDGKLGIGIVDPDIKLHIVDSNTQIKLGHQPAYDGPYINIYGSSTEAAPMLGLGVANKVYYKFADTLAMKDWAYLYGNNLNLGIAILPDMQYATKGVYIDRKGSVGLNTKNPNSRLEIADGDIYISDIDKGIIMKSPDGQCWRGVLDNTGNLIFTMIDCPEEGPSDIADQLKSSESVSIFPNPTENYITIKLERDDFQKPRYSIYSVNGQLADVGRIKTNIQTIDISLLSDGIYFLNIYDKNGNNLAIEKIIKN